MTLIRILIIALVAWLLLRMLKNWANRNSIEKKDNNAKIATVVPCQHCGLHVPKNEAIRSNQQYYCCQEHLRLHNKQH